MKDYVIITDSTCDLTIDIVKRFNLEVIPFCFFIGEKEYHDYTDKREMDPAKFYQLLREGKTSTTSQISVNRYMEVLEKYIEQDKDILFIGFSSALSGTYNSLNLAKNQVLEEYPEAKIEVIDSRSASMGEGLLVYNALLKKEEGLSFDELREWINNNKYSYHHWFTVDDIDFLKRGGRLTGTQAIVAKTLKIKPVLNVNELGQLISMKKVFGRRSAIATLFERMTEEYVNDENETIFIAHCDCIDDVNSLIEMIKNKLKFKEIIINYIGPVIGAHTGPGCLALFFKAHENNR